MQRGYPIHFYLQALKSASDCLRELTFDSLKNINTVKLPVSDTGVVILPCDFVDDIKVGVERGQLIKPLVQKDSINRLQRKDSTGTPINYDQIEDGEVFSPVIFESDYISDDGEPLGRMFGFNAGWITDGYKVLRERGEIQIEQGVCTDSIYLEYISDGQCTDNATRVHPYAQKTIETYIFWQFKEHSRTYGAQERELAKREFEAQRRILRARLNPLKKEDYMRIARKGYSATIKG